MAWNEKKEESRDQLNARDGKEILTVEAPASLPFTPFDSPKRFGTADGHVSAMPSNSSTSTAQKWNGRYITVANI